MQEHAFVRVRTEQPRHGWGGELRLSRSVLDHRDARRLHSDAAGRTRGSAQSERE